MGCHMRAMGFAVGAALVTAGCMSSQPPPPNPTEVKIAADLAKINERLTKLEKQIPEPQVNRDNNRGVDREALAKIDFPKDPNKENLRKYVKAICDLSSQQNSFGSDDPQVWLLKRVGAANLDLLIEQMNSPNSFHLQYAINDLADARSKDVIINALPQHHALILAVWRNGWAKDVEPVLIAALRQNQYLPPEWLYAIASLKNPAYNAALVKFLINGQSRFETYRILRELPGVKITDDDIREAWKRQLYNLHDQWGIVNFAIVAVSIGEPKALEVLVDSVSKSRYSYYQPQILNAIWKHSELTGSPQELQDAYQKVKYRLYFDSADRKFKVKAATVPAAAPAPAAGGK